MTDLATFATLVARMRTAQKRRSRSRSAQKDALKLEEEVDRTLREIEPQSVGVAAEIAEQKRLFE